MCQATSEGKRVGVTTERISRHSGSLGMSGSQRVDQ